MSDLDPAEFPAFFRAVFGHAPFPWQEELASIVFREGWPAALDVPTGAGKTAAIDIALFHLALEASKPTPRRAPLRIVFVVDRRLVVDDAHARARKIARALSDAKGSDVLARVAARLLSFAHPLLGERDRAPVRVARLRGGAPSDPDWARTPSQPTIVLSTVDQVGSRLLFRGYGVSDSMKPVHAGLLGADALFLLDEAHLSAPFVTTVQDLHESDLQIQERRVIDPFHVVTLSATQRATAPPLLGERDRKDPVLGPRLNRSKPARLVARKEGSSDAAFAQAFVEEALSLSALGRGAAPVTAIVVNRVARARTIFELLRARFGEAADVDLNRCGVALLIGRCRPLDRQRILGTESDPGLLARMRAGRATDVDAPPLVLVATQCVEAGADLDFDALVTELAPLDALRQRFGRLNRMGRGIDARATILAAADQIGARAKPDPVYGEALPHTWELLGRAQDGGVVDFGVEASRAWLPSGDALLPYLASQDAAPVLLPAFVEQWSHTSPIPVNDPEVALFLHGLRAGAADVQLVWRADFSDGDDEWQAKVEGCPPSSLEALSVPVHEARRWLEGTGAGDIADVEAASDVDERGNRRSKRVYRWRGTGDPQTRDVSSWEVRAGDLLVVPAERGGCDVWGWNPRSTEPVKDLGGLANEQHRSRSILRLAPQLLQAELLDGTSRSAADWAAARRASERLESKLDALAEASDADVKEEMGALSIGAPYWAAWWSEAEGRERFIRVSRTGSGRPLSLELRAQARAEGDEGAAVTEDDMSSRGVRAVPLKEHSRGVGDLAASFARLAGLSQELAADVALAAFLHDAGKAHEAFQMWLYGGDELAVLAGQPLAKSGRVDLGHAARRLSGLPKGARHEVASLGFAERHPKLREAHDPALVLWLIGTHHGHGRPLFPSVEWPARGTSFEVDLGDDAGRVRSAEALPLPELTARWIDMRSDLTARYGPWGLARMEAILRLADHRRSELEQEQEGAP